MITLFRSYRDRGSAADQDLIVWADCHPAHAFASVDVDEMVHCHLRGIDHRHLVLAAGVRWNVLVKLPGIRAPLALLNAGALIKRKVAKHLISVGRDEGNEGAAIAGRLCRTRDHDDLIFGIETELVGSGCG